MGPFPRSLGAVLRAAIVLSLSTAVAGAQRRTPATATPYTWGGVGVGLGSAGLMLELDLARLTVPRLLRARFTAHSNLGGFGTAPDESVVELSALVGRGGLCCRGNWGSASIGGGVVSGTLGFEARRFTTVGLAAEASLLSWRRPHVTVTAYGNLNPERSFAGVSMSLAIGRTPFADF